MSDELLGELVDKTGTLDCKLRVSGELLGELVDKTGTLETLTIRAALVNARVTGHADAEANWISHEFLGELVDKTDTLETLTIRAGHRISDEFLGELVDKTDTLETLSIRGCAQITDIFLEGHSNDAVQITGCKLKQPHTLAIHIRGWTCE
ncbi:hypothetical protein T484DRAFT_1764584 [Baffinella frigidus]|nr:hypothetical protein T484DRAFT_1764584 [Cryptophyta sp. CCMP2293]